ncbi:MAG: amidohydrolase family protein [Acidobacteria bacterium]|nr:amidohydrolase family protein [Acidobacteriota bacterium]
MVHVHAVTAGQHHGSFHYVLQLSHVAGPAPLKQLVRRTRPKPGHGQIQAGSRVSQELARKRQHVVPALAERRNTDLDHAQPVVQILSESASRDFSGEEALRLFTVGSAWFSGDEQIKGRIAPGQLADFAVLTADYLAVPEEQIKNIESALTVLGGDVVYAAAPFDRLAPPRLPAVLPAWSPVAHFGGVQAAQRGTALAIRSGTLPRRR